MKANEVLNLLKITRPTLCKYVKRGTIRVTQRPNGYYVFGTDSEKLIINTVKSLKKEITKK